MFRINNILNSVNYSLILFMQHFWGHLKVHDGFFSDDQPTPGWTSSIWRSSGPNPFSRLARDPIGRAIR